ncbi:MAG: hypothetical protein ACF8PN_14000 [Phycisphaerales bacterium]
MSISTGRAKLESARHNLLRSWNRVTAHWNDPVAKDFESRYVELMDERIRRALSSIEEIADVLARARRDCE